LLWYTYSTLYSICILLLLCPSQILSNETKKLFPCYGILIIEKLCSRKPATWQCNLTALQNRVLAGITSRRANLVKMPIRVIALAVTIWVVYFRSHVQKLFRITERRVKRGDCRSIKSAVFTFRLAHCTCLWSIFRKTKASH
jgi:hypothetical protein